MLELLKPLVDKWGEPEVWNDYYEFSVDGDEGLEMEEMALLMSLCKEHGLVFEIGTSVDYTTRAGYLAYDSSVWANITITIKRGLDTQQTSKV